MKLLKNNKGVAITVLVIAAVALLVFAYLAPIALNYIAVAVNATRVPATVRLVFVTLGSIIFAVGVALRFIPRK